MSAKHLTKAEFQTFTNGGFTLIDFYAEWCGPCKMMGPVIDEMAPETNGVKVAKVNVDEQAELAQQFGVSSIPTVVLLKNGKEISRFNGYKPKQQIVDFLNRNKK